MVSPARSRYSSPFDLPDPLSGSSAPAWQRWADDIDPYGERYQSALDTYAPQTDYVWGQPYHGGEEYTPSARGESYTPMSVQLGTQLTNQGIDQWLLEKYPELNNFGGLGSGQNNPGQISSPNDPAWAGVNAWDPVIMDKIKKVAADTGVLVPANLVKAIMRVESGGVWTDSDPGAGAIGVMQVMPFWDGTYGLNVRDRNENVELGIRILVDNYKAGNPETGEDSWEWAAKRYLGLGGADAYGTDSNTYWQRVNQYWNELGMNTVPVGGDPTNPGGTAAPPGTNTFNAIWGNIPAGISQEFGPTPFSQGEGAWMYGYARDYGVNGHPGVDVGISEGTRLFTPVNGTVMIDGGTQYYTDTNFGPFAPKTGELRIKLDNGDELILGHMQQIIVREGDRLVAGQPVGFSGTNNGPHVHVEYRKLTPGVNTYGFTAIDPRLALTGAFGGSFTAPPPGSTFAPANPNNWQSFLRAGALNLPILLAPPENTFGSYLRQLMGLGPPVVSTGSEAPTGWSWTDFNPNPTGSTGTGTNPATP